MKLEVLYSCSYLTVGNAETPSKQIIPKMLSQLLVFQAVIFHISFHCLSCLLIPFWPFVGRVLLVGLVSVGFCSLGTERWSLIAHLATLCLL